MEMVSIFLNEISISIGELKLDLKSEQHFKVSLMTAEHKIWSE